MPLRCPTQTASRRGWITRSSWLNGIAFGYRNFYNFRARIYFTTRSDLWKLKICGAQNASHIGPFYSNLSSPTRLIDDEPKSREKISRLSLLLFIQKLLDDCVDLIAIGFAFDFRHYCTHYFPNSLVKCSCCCNCFCNNRTIHLQKVEPANIFQQLISFWPYQPNRCDQLFQTPLENLTLFHLAR